MYIIPLSQGKVATIDNEDIQLISPYKWHLIPTKRKNSWYAGMCKNGKTIYLHRLIMGFPLGIDIDHIDGNGLNCRRYNMRKATRFQNIRNQRIRTDNKSGFRGVSFSTEKRNKPWIAHITVNYKTIHLGRFQTAKEAAKAYNVASIKYFGNWGIRNFISE